MVAIVIVSVLCLTGIASGFNAYSGTEVCCNGVKGKTSVNACCGTGEFYDITKDLCCGGKLIKGQSVTTNYSCCLDGVKNSASFNENSQVCCSGVVVNKKNLATNYGCCGTEAFDFENFLCCNNKVVPGGPKNSCCGDKGPYNVEKMFCNYENGTFKLVEIKDKKSALCGADMFDPLKKACCYDEVKGKRVLVDNEKGILKSACCTTPKSSVPKVYDFTSQICCSDGVVLDVPKGLTDFVYGCCEGKVIPYNQTCCANKIYKETGYCCGEKFAYNNETCCAGKIYKGAGICCDGVFSLGENMFCCNKQPVKQGAKFELDCCQLGGGVQKSFNNTEKLCCDSKLHDKKPETLMECCYTGNKPFDALKENCGVAGVTSKNKAELADASDAVKKCGPNFSIRSDPIIFF